jgi:hypothetical protein
MVWVLWGSRGASLVGGHSRGGVQRRRLVFVAGKEEDLGIVHLLMDGHD